MSLVKLVGTKYWYSTCRSLVLSNRAASRHLVVDRHFEHHVGRADLPALREFGQRRNLRRIALARAARHPGRDGVDLRLGKAQVVAKVAVAPVGVPGRHLARRHFLVNRSRPGPCFPERDERHRGHLALPVAADALLVEDRRDVLAERGPTLQPAGGLLREQLAAKGGAAQPHCNRGDENAGAHRVARHEFLRYKISRHLPATIPPQPPRVTPGGRCRSASPEGAGPDEVRVAAERRFARRAATGCRG